ncbi:MAG: hypothetical protein ACTSUE_12235 [Promethearchaeota archaeon]
MKDGSGGSRNREETPPPRIHLAFIDRAGAGNPLANHKYSKPFPF